MSMDGSIRIIVGRIKHYSFKISPVPNRAFHTTRQVQAAVWESGVI